jgi:hypothetical protein
MPVAHILKQHKFQVLKYVQEFHIDDYINGNSSVIGCYSSFHFFSNILFSDEAILYLSEARDKHHWMQESHVQKDPKVMKLWSGMACM